MTQLANKAHTPLVWLLLFAALLGHNTVGFGAVPEPLQAVGSGKARWFTFTLYQAELFSSSGSFQTLQTASYPLALSITYQRTIAGQTLVDATESEWQRLQLSHRQEWVTQLGKLWPDVSDGDNLTFVAHNADSGEFFFNQRSLGRIEGATFAETFLAIWLSPDTRDPRLRAALIGASS